MVEKIAILTVVFIICVLPFLITISGVNNDIERGGEE